MTVEEISESEEMVAELSESEKIALREKSISVAKENDKIILWELSKKVIKSEKNALDNTVQLWLQLNDFEGDAKNAKSQYPGKNSGYDSDYESEEGCVQTDENLEDPKQYPTSDETSEQFQNSQNLKVNSQLSQKNDQYQDQNSKPKPPFYISKRPSLLHELSPSVRADLEELKKIKKIQAYYALKKYQNQNSGQNNCDSSTNISAQQTQMNESSSLNDFSENDLVIETIDLSLPSKTKRVYTKNSTKAKQTKLLSSNNIQKNATVHNQNNLRIEITSKIIANVKTTDSRSIDVDHLDHELSNTSTNMNYKKPNNIKNSNPRKTLETKLKSRKGCSKTVKESNDPAVLKNMEKHSRSHDIELKSACIMENGLLADVEYYKQINEPIFTTGMYIFPKEMLHISGAYNVTVQNELMMHLIDETAWISTDMMEAFSAVTAEPGVIFVSTTLTALMFASNYEITAKDWVMNKDLKWIENQNPRKMFFPVLYDGHWVLFVLDFEDKTAFTLDPRIHVSRNYLMVTYQHFQRYLQESRKICTNFINNINWKFVENKTLKPLQTESIAVNCAIYVMYYAECMTKRIPFDMAFNPIKYRHDVYQKLIEKTKFMASYCQLCFRTNLKKGISCNFCKRFTHTTCFKKSYNLHKLSLNLKSGFYCYFCLKYIDNSTK